MARKRFTAEQIIMKLREAAVSTRVRARSAWVGVADLSLDKQILKEVSSGNF